MSLQEALRQMRLELSMTQTDLARKLNKSFVAVNRWENGRGFPSRENARNLLAIAQSGPVSKECLRYLEEMLMPEAKRGKSAAAYGFPDIDREFLFQLADASANALYVIEAGTYNLLYANRKAERSAVNCLIALGKPVSERRITEQADRRCFHYFSDRDEPCPFCPLRDFGHDASKDVTLFNPDVGKTLLVHAKRMKMHQRDVYVIYLTDITERNDERNALYALTNDILDGVGIYHVYYDGRIELAFMNETFYKMIGDEKRDALMKNGETDLSLIHPEDRRALRAEISASIAGKRSLRITIRMREASGAYRTVRLHGRPIKQDSEKFTYYCLFRALNQP